MNEETYASALKLIEEKLIELIQSTTDSPYVDHLSRALAETRKACGCLSDD